MTDAAARTDALFEPWTRPGEPGGALLVLQGGEVVHRADYGLANLEHAVPIAPGTRFHIASITKGFAAAALLILEARGKLRLDDPCGRYLPELPAELNVSIRRLLDMTSGLRDAMEMMRLRGIWFRYPRSARDLMELLYAQREFSFPTGERYVYTNVNYMLAALIVENVTGQPWDQYCRDNIWAPLGMADTGMRDDCQLVWPRLADGYVQEKAGGHTKGVWAFGISGAGSMVSTVEDLARWVLCLRQGSLGGVALSAPMTTPGRLNDGRLNHYGLGLHCRPYRGLTVIGHGGSLTGYKGMICHVPDRDWGFVLLSNREDADPYGRVQQLFDLWLGDSAPRPRPAEEARALWPKLELAAETVAALPGRWVDRDTAELATITLKDGTLELDKLGNVQSFRATGPGRLLADWSQFDSTLEIHERRGEPPLLDLDFGGQELRLHKLEKAHDYGREGLELFCGSYSSRELAVTHEVFLRDGALMIRLGPAFHEAAELPLQATLEDCFLAQDTRPGYTYALALRFERSEWGRVESVVLSTDRLKGVRFLKTA